MRARMAVIVVIAGGKDVIVANAINRCHSQQVAAIRAVSSIPFLPPSTTTTIAAVDNHHCHCHTVDNNNCQKPVVVFCC
jgi:hypothetical protein